MTGLAHCRRSHGGEPHEGNLKYERIIKRGDTGKNENSRASKTFFFKINEDVPVPFLPPCPAVQPRPQREGGRGWEGALYVAPSQPRSQGGYSSLPGA